MAAGRLVRVRFDKTEDGGFGLVDDIPQRFAPFPKAIYHTKEGPRLVTTKEGLEKALKAGWSETPIRPQDQDKREPPPNFDE